HSTTLLTRPPPRSTLFPYTTLFRSQLKRDPLGSSTRLRRSMPTKAVYFLAVPGFADWEAAHALAELRRHGQYDVHVMGFTREPVQSMGGLTVQPTAVLAELDPADVAVFILPGGDRWEQQPVERELVEALKTLEARA